jgi:hypothetical protein
VRQRDQRGGGDLADPEPVVDRAEMATATLGFSAPVAIEVAIAFGGWTLGELLEE